MDIEKSLTRKITLRIIPFVMVLYTAAYVDRSAVGFAQLHMTTDIGVDSAAYGFGAPIPGETAVGSFSALAELLDRTSLF